MQLLKAFQKMRDKNFVHRDIKPQNIRVHNNILKIADFGLAKAKLMKDSPKLYDSVGTKMYAAP
jgi:serine/threonine protein kinase